MKLFGRSIVIAIACMLVVSTQVHADGAAFEHGVATIRAYFEKNKDFPADPAFYAETIRVSHNYDTGETINSKAYLARVAAAHAGDKPPANIKHELTRLLVAGDTIVATLLSTGTYPNGTPLRVNITYFVKVGPDGRIVEKETWLDRASINTAAPRPTAPNSNH
jgi:SnoaL-like domain